MPHPLQDDPAQDLPPGLGRPALRTLTTAGYTRLDVLTEITEADLQKLHGMGPKAIGLLRAELAARGLSFRAPSQGR